MTTPATTVRRPGHSEDFTVDSKTYRVYAFATPLDGMGLWQRVAAYLPATEDSATMAEMQKVLTMASLPMDEMKRIMLSVLKTVRVVSEAGEYPIVLGNDTFDSAYQSDPALCYDVYAQALGFHLRGFFGRALSASSASAQE